MKFGIDIPNGKKNEAEQIALVEAYAAVGVTWWLDCPAPGGETLSALRQRIRQGPPRIS